MSRISRGAELWLIAVAMATTAGLLYLIGYWTDVRLVQFVGFMSMASTFVPMPADAFLINASANWGLSPLTVGVVGGTVNAVAVLVEAHWLRTLASYPIFTKFRQFFGTNKYVNFVERHLFVGLLVTGFSPLPFEPFRLVAALSNYRWWRYAVATFLGRGFRYYMIASSVLLIDSFMGSWSGRIITAFIWGTLLLFAVGLIRSYINLKVAPDTEDVDARS